MDSPSPLQNRVAPDGSLHAVPARGALMGNRGGRLHGPDKRLGRARWKSKAWIACVLDFRGRHRAVMGAGYTELFFLDEATALAAGHRPCYECRRRDARAFAAAWSRGHGTAREPRAGEMDSILHTQRRSPERATFGTLPDGTLFRHDGRDYLCHGGGVHAWSFEGYLPAPLLPAEACVIVHTPAGIRAAIGAGYAPQVHPSAIRA